jgi:hypothetical protein
MDELDDMLGGLFAPSPPPESPAQHGVAEYDDLVNGLEGPNALTYVPWERYNLDESVRTSFVNTTIDETLVRSIFCLIFGPDSPTESRPGCLKIACRNRSCGRSMGHLFGHHSIPRTTSRRTTVVGC